jgi:hypothetical protein
MLKLAAFLCALSVIGLAFTENGATQASPDRRAGSLESLLDLGKRNPRADSSAWHAYAVRCLCAREWVCMPTDECFRQGGSCQSPCP